MLARMKLPELNPQKLFLFVIMLPTTIVFIAVAIIHRDSREFKVTDEVYLDITSEGKSLGQIVVGLFGDDVPKTVHNFLTLATKGHDDRRYQGTRFHRVIKQFMIQGGDVVSDDGHGTSFSVYGRVFSDENLSIKHGTPGFISMANTGKDTNGCQFFITTVATPWLDGHHVVFGKVKEGLSVVREIENVATDWNDRPLKDIIIANAGRRIVKGPYNFTDDPYNLRNWVKMVSFPVGCSFFVLFLFNRFIKKLDVGILANDGAFEDDSIKQRKILREEEEEKKKLEEEERNKIMTEEEMEVRKRVVKIDKK